MDLKQMIQASLEKAEAEREKSVKPTQVVSKKKAKEQPQVQTVAVGRKLRAVMQTAEIVDVILKIKAGDNVQIQFKEQDIADVNYLRGMHHDGCLTVDASDELVMMAVVMSGSWDHPTNRIFILKANDGWDKDWFSGRLADRLEAIAIV